MKSTEVKNKFIDLRAKGISFDKIARELKTSKKTLLNWDKEFKMEIDKLKAIEMTTLLKKYYVSKRESIKTIGETLNKINDEIEKINFSKIPPEKLLSLKLRYIRELKKERGEGENEDLPIFIDFKPAHCRDCHKIERTP